MSNAYAGLFATLPAAMADASKAKVANNFLLDACYKDFRPAVAMEFDTININVPNSNFQVQDIAGREADYQDAKSIPVSIQLNRHPALLFPVPDYDQARTPQGIRDTFLDEAIKSIANWIDGLLGALCTSTTFNVYAPVAGTSTAQVDDSQMSAAIYANMANNDVNVRDEQNMFMVTQAVVYGNQGTKPTWSQYNDIGPMAGDVRRTGLIGRQWGVLCDYDRFVPQPTSNTYSALVFHRYALALAARPLKIPEVGGVKSIVLYYRGLPLRITIDWNQKRMAETVSVDALCGVTASRTDHGCIILTN